MLDPLKRWGYGVFETKSMTQDRMGVEYGIVGPEVCESTVGQGMMPARISGGQALFCGSFGARGKKLASYRLILRFFTFGKING